MSAVRPLALLLCLLPVPAWGQDPEPNRPSAAGYNKVRVEQEERLAVPLEKGAEVWAYLLQRFVTDPGFVRSLGGEFASRWDLEEFWDTYYDTPSLQALQKQHGIRYRRRLNHSSPEDAKSGRELLQIKLSDIGENPLERGEIKYSIEHPGRINEMDDRHPLFGIVLPSHRRELKERLVSMGMAPYSMRPVLTVHDMRSRIYLTRNGLPFMSISFDRASSQIWWARMEFMEVEPELNEIAFTEADPAARRAMEAVLELVVKDVRDRFPFLQRNLTPKYNRAFDQLATRIPGLRTLVAANLHRTSGLIALILMGVLGLAGAVFGTVKLLTRERGRTRARRIRTA